jgi:xanthine dehydrogenase accessory factor
MKRGNGMGRLIEEGPAAPDTGVPGEVAGATEERLLRSPAAGRFDATHAIGDVVEAGTIIGSVAGNPVTASIGGLLRGLIAEGTAVERGEKIGDVDPRGSSIDPTAISDKARSVGGAVLEALLSRGLLPSEGTNGE